MLPRESPYPTVSTDIMQWGLGTLPTSVGSSACALSKADDAACRACSSSHLRIGQRARLQPGLLAPKHKRQARRRERAAAGPSRAGVRSARQPRAVCRIIASREAGNDGLRRRWLRSTRQARASGRAAGGMRSGSTVVIVPLKSARQQVCGVRLGEAAQAAVHAAHAAGAAREADAAGAGGERLLQRGHLCGALERARSQGYLRDEPVSKQVPVMCWLDMDETSVHTHSTPLSCSAKSTRSALER